MISVLFLIFATALAQIDTCVNLWTPLLIDETENIGVMYKQLYTDWQGYDQHTRISAVCIWRDDAAYNGTRERVNGL
jgi:hypothetical protein